MRAIPLLLALVLLATGCLGGGDEGDDAPQAARLGDAPWWEVGEYWLVTIQRADGSTEDFKLVNFWNDSDSHHFWLGTPDRAQALDMALHDDMPLLGRIHWNILTPHERGIHAHGLYTFPVSVGEQFGGLAFDRDWSIDVKNGTKPGQLLFEGASGDRASMRYDFDLANNWFSSIEVKDRQGNTEVRLDVKEHGTGAPGAHWFLRGRDYYEAEDPSGTHDDAFDVDEEDVAHKSLAIEVKGRVSGPLRIDFVDPSGVSRHSETLTGGDVARIVEIPTPAVGAWTARYVGTGTLEGTVEAVGILEYTRTL